MNRREFGWAPGLQVVFCRICDTHISANRYGVFFEISSSGEPMGFFQYAINLETGEFWNIDGDTVAVNVYCSVCNTLLGIKFVLVEEPLTYPRVGTVLLLLEKLKLLTGDGILEAATLVPLEPPEPEAESDPEPDVKPDPEPEDQLEPESEAQREAEPEPEVRPDPEPKAQPVPKPEAQPEPDPEPEPEPEPDDSS